MSNQTPLAGRAGRALTERFWKMPLFKGNKAKQSTGNEWPDYVSMRFWISAKVKRCFLSSRIPAQRGTMSGEYIW